MGAFRDPVIGQILVSSTLLFFLVGSLTGIAVGLGLLARTAATLRVFGVMNRWVSTRRALKPLEVPRDMTPTTGPGARWMGLIIVLLGGYALVVLVLSMDPSRVASAFRIASSPLAAMALKAARYFLVVGCLFAVVSGVLLLFFPAAWSRLEQAANHWYSSRKMVAGGDRMHFTLDRLVESFPRASGSVVLVLSIVSALASALLLSSR
jgi:uncharacterized protein YjeT (DUF2065 family)